METERPEGYGFSFKDYRETLEAYKSAGYEVTGFAKYLQSPNSKHLILRHDCDNSLTQALRIARIDAEAGCTATFFVRVHAVGYNLLSLSSLQAIREIETLGHSVELHLEGGIPELLGDTMDTWADRQRSVFEAAMGRSPRGFSSHEPARMGNVRYADELLTRWNLDFHAYETRFTSPAIKYLSDSSANWREGHFRLWIDREPVIQVLTHPIWWFERIPQENY
jgi:hypothetical protein